MYMKLCTINVVNDTGSTGRIAAALCRAVDRAGGESLFLYGRGGAPGDIASHRVGTDRTMYVHAALSRLTGRQGFYARRETERAVSVLASFDPDVIHLHNVHGYYLHIPTLFSYLRECGKPVVWTLHDCWAFTGRCAYFDMAHCDRWETGCGACVRMDAYPKSWLLDSSAKSFVEKRALFSALPDLTLVTPSEWLKRLLARSFLSDKRVLVMPNGIDLGVFRPTQSDLIEQYGLKGRKVLLGATNIWEPRKGLPFFFKLREALDASYAIVLIGLTEKQRRELPDGILGLARTADIRTLAAWYTAADVFVDCTLEDTFPTTHIEALACGTPVVTFAAGGSAEMLDERCGAGVPVGDIEGMCAAIPRALTMESGACIARARQYDAGERLAAYLPVYEACMRAARGAGTEEGVK